MGGEPLYIFWEKRLPPNLAQEFWVGFVKGKGFWNLGGIINFL